MWITVENNWISKKNRKKKAEMPSIQGQIAHAFVDNCGQLISQRLEERKDTMAA